MVWSNKALRATFTAEKAHSLAFTVRVEDRMHQNIIQPTDECWFTVRPAAYTQGFNDTDITLGTGAVVGNGVRSDATITGTGESTVFRFAVQAAQLNLDPELDYWYDITYVRDGYSLAVASGEFVVAANPTNRGVEEQYTNTGSAQSFIAQIGNTKVLNVTASMPMPPAGAPGTGSYVVARALSQTVGNTTNIAVRDIATPSNRPAQVGDVIFSSVTTGVLATIQSISTVGGVLTAAIVTRQVYGRDPLKALLDTKLHIVDPNAGVTVETIDSTWTLPKAQVPLPAGYTYLPGDLVFSHSAVSGLAVNKKLIISIVEAVNSTALTVRTKVAFPIFLSNRDIAELVGTMVPDSRTINGQALDANVTLTEDNIAAGTSYAKISHTQLSKLDGLPSASTLGSRLAGKANSSHSHSMSDISGLSTALSGKVGSSTISAIWSGTQAQYDAISPKSSTTLYVIKS